MNESTLFDKHLAQYIVDRSNLTGAQADTLRETIQQLSAAIFAGHSCIRTDKPQVSSSLCIDGVDFAQQKEAPLVYDNGRLYFYRYYKYEQRLAKQLWNLATQKIAPITATAMQKTLDQLFDASALAKGEIDFQRKAAEAALQKALTIISGGPGTGKTTTVTKILAAFVLLSGTPPTVALTAPTGKAAMRLSESISNALHLLDRQIAQHIPTEAMTLHRLLGVRQGRPDFVHNSHNPLDYDLVIVDESSMVDLALMSKLVDSLKPQTCLILLGDRDQLASVESGAVVADIMESLPECSVQLQKTWRFDADIAALAAAINSKDADTTQQIIQKCDTLHLEDDNNWINNLVEPYRVFIDNVQQQNGAWNDDMAAQAFADFALFRFLAALRKGKRGMEEINIAVEAYLTSIGYYCRPSQRNPWYLGRPIMVTRNDYLLGLFNGDIGICLPGRSGEKECVWFESHTRSEKQFRIVPYNRLPHHETAFAMTIHKSQGSEFDSVAVILPKQVNPLLSKELLYTAVTRAKKEVWIVADDNVLEGTICGEIMRMGGLQTLVDKERNLYTELSSI